MILSNIKRLLNAFSKYETTENVNAELFLNCFKKFIKLLAPCAPHFSEEIWEMLGNKGSIFHEEYPVCDEKALTLDEVEIAVQINSKMRAKLVIPSDIDEAGIRTLILSDEKLSAEIGDKPIKKLIIVPKRLVNIIL